MSYHQFTNESGEQYGSFELFRYDLESFSHCKGSDGLFYVTTDCFTPDGGLTEEELPAMVGWYWQACFPGCLPDGDASGPFENEQEAIKDATDYI